jgi:hypothetical protein
MGFRYGSLNIEPDITYHLVVKGFGRMFKDPKQKEYEIFREEPIGVIPAEKIDDGTFPLLAKHLMKEKQSMIDRSRGEKMKSSKSIDDKVKVLKEIVGSVRASANFDYLEIARFKKFPMESYLVVDKKGLYRKYWGYLTGSAGPEYLTARKYADAIKEFNVKKETLYRILKKMKGEK